ncbi:MAG: translation initiation factor IF-2 subunit alpha [Sulfolobales archaeon]
MVLKRKQIPDVGELVIATVKEIFDYGAYVTLDEYRGYRAFLPWSEITARHFKDVKEVLREGQRVVAKVIRVDRTKKPPAIDVSTKKVSEEERRDKMILWKRAQKAHNVLEVVAKRLGVGVETIYEKAGWKLEDRYREIMRGLEELAIRGEDAAAGLGIDENILKILVEEARRHVEIKKVSISGIITAKSRAPDGIKRIKNLLGGMIDEVSKKYSGSNVKIEIYTLGAPRYRLTLEGTDYKVLERVLSEAIENAKDMAKKLGIEFSFERS